MKIQLINGQFTANETIELVSQMIQVKIKFLEKKISNLHHEEDIKSKETKIVKLQNTLSALRQKIISNDRNLEIACEIEIKL